MADISDIKKIKDSNGVVHPVRDDSKLPLSGGTLTGDLNGKGISATSLKLTSDNHNASKQEKIAVIDTNGQLGNRTLEEVKTDLDIDKAVIAVDPKSTETSSDLITYYSKSEADNKFQKKVTVSAEDPSGGSDGDIWIKVEEDA